MTELIIPTDFLRRGVASAPESLSIPALRIMQDENGTTAESTDGYVLHRLHDGRASCTYPRTDYITDVSKYPTEFVLQADALTKALRKPDSPKDEVVVLVIADDKLLVQRGETTASLAGAQQGPPITIKFFVKHLRPLVAVYAKREVKIRFNEPKKQARIEGGMNEFSIIMPCVK